MPFIKQERREAIAKHTLRGLYKVDMEIQPGDRCYVFYKEMVLKWKGNPCWTTAHEIRKAMYAKDYILEEEDMIAEDLAWQVFFIRWVWPYELEKMEENGDIT